MRLLVSHGAMINLLGGVDEWTPLFFSALAGLLFELIVVFCVVYD